MIDERPIPHAALRDKNAVEMLRVWIAEKQLHCSIKIGMYKEEGIKEGGAWGVILADITRHIAAAMEEGYAEDNEEIIREIQSAYLKELNKSTSDATGEFIKKTNKH